MYLRGSLRGGSIWIEYLNREVRLLEKKGKNRDIIDRIKKHILKQGGIVFMAFGVRGWYLIV